MVQTSEIVRQQIVAMQSTTVEIGVFRMAGSVGGLDAGMRPRAWDSETLLRSVAWLRFENMRGRNIYIRPQGEHHLSLVDDRSTSTIDRMKAEGFQPAAIVETSPRNSRPGSTTGKDCPGMSARRLPVLSPVDSRERRKRRLAPFRTHRGFHQSKREASSVERAVSLRAIDRIDR